MKQVMVRMMAADGHIDDSEKETLRNVYRDIAHAELSDGDIQREVTSARRGEQDFLDSLRGLGARLNEHGKENVARAAVMIAAADGEFQTEERQLLEKIVAAIEMAPAHFRGLMAELTAPSTAQ